MSTLQFKSAIQKKGWDAELYAEIYQKCMTPQYLSEEEYNRAMHLTEIGLMIATRTPIWFRDSYQGMKVEF
jgi:predicted SPOUT superfamily RNA methylase MTH1